MNAGCIKEGALADIAIVDMENYHFMSPASFEANLIYSAHSDCIDSVICNGRFVMKNRVVPGEKEILEEARKILHIIVGYGSESRENHESCRLYCGQA